MGEEDGAIEVRLALLSGQVKYGAALQGPPLATRALAANRLALPAMSFALSLLVLASIALVLGAIVLWRREGYRRQAVLMLVLAAIMAGNVALLTVPVKGGGSIATQGQRKEAPR